MWILRAFFNLGLAFLALFLLAMAFVTLGVTQNWVGAAIFFILAVIVIAYNERQRRR
jgi:hypothetical protein